MNELEQLKLDKARFELYYANPHIPLDVIRAAPAQTPEELTAFVATLATAMPRQQAQAGAPAPAGAPVPVPPDNATRAAETENQRQLREWQHDVRWRAGQSNIGPQPTMRLPHRGPRTRISPDDAKDAQWAFFTTSWNRHMAKLNRAFGGGDSRSSAGMSDVSAPPRFVALPLPGEARI